MSPADDEAMIRFERSARAALEEGVLRIDGRTRSRLNQARQAALAAARAPRRAGWRGLAFMPAAGAVAAALLVAVVLWHREPEHALPVLDPQHPAAEDMDLLTDSEALDLIEGWDGPFYEWAVSQPDSNAESNG